MSLPLDWSPSPSSSLGGGRGGSGVSYNPMVKRVLSRTGGEACCSECKEKLDVSRQHHPAKRITSNHSSSDGPCNWEVTIGREDLILNFRIATYCIITRTESTVLQYFCIVAESRDSRIGYTVVAKDIPSRQASEERGECMRGSMSERVSESCPTREPARDFS